MKTRILFPIAVVALSATLLLIPSRALAHCDTMDGPVVKSAQKALEQGDVKPVLIWIRRADEAEIKSAFAQTLSVRKLGPQARELADRYFFETLVRIHRAGEGAPYTGLKPAGTDVSPAISLADKALETGDATALLKALETHLADGLRQRFTEAVQKKDFKPDDVAAGREYVRAYVEFLHYVEHVHSVVESANPHEPVESSPAAHQH